MPCKALECIPTGCGCLNRIMGGGIPKKQVTLVYGEFKTGKTTLAIQCATQASRKKMRSLYIDCDNSFSPERLGQIASYDLAHVSPLIFIFKPKSFLEQSLIIEDLEIYLSKGVALIVVDTITSLYRLELKNPGMVFSSNRSLNRQLAYLNQVAKAHDVSVLITSQVHNIMRGGYNKRVEPSAARVLRFWSQNILRIEICPRPSLRRVVLEKHSEASRVGDQCLTILGGAGLVDIDKAGF